MAARNGKANSMLSRINGDRYATIKASARERISQFPLINAVLSEAQHGQVYEDLSGESFFVATKSGFSLYHPQSPDHEFDNRLLDFLIYNENIPSYIHFYSPSETLKKHLA